MLCRGVSLPEMGCPAMALFVSEKILGTRDLEEKFFESSVEVLEKNLAVRFPL